MDFVFPNIFALLIAPPGVGKSQAIAQARNILRRTQRLKMAPDDMTKASLLDALSAAKQTRVYSPTNMEEYHSMFVCADELGILLPAHDLQFLNVLNILYDNRDSYKEDRRGRPEDLEIPHPQINILAGTQPDYLATLLPPEAWGMGFMTRIIMVYHGTKSKPKLFGTRSIINTTSLLDDMKSIAELHGEMEWHPEAEALLTEWYDVDMPPIPQHAKLKHYLPRRILHIIKLCMISAVSRNNDLVVEAVDVERARDWLLEVEALMPEIFKDMSGNSDMQVIQDLHHYVWELWLKGNKKPIHRSRIDVFLMNRTPARNINYIMDKCLSAKVLIQYGPDLFTPGTKNSTGEYD